jgi:hypothetical protein
MECKEGLFEVDIDELEFSENFGKASNEGKGGISKLKDLRINKNI